MLIDTFVCGLYRGSTSLHTAKGNEHLHAEKPLLHTGDLGVIYYFL